MAGSLRERSPGVWELRAFMGKDPVTGKPRQKSKTFKGGKRAAGKELARFVAEVSEQRITPTHGTVTDLLHRWLGELERKGASPLYVSNARYVTEARLIPALGALPLVELTAQHLDQFYGAEQAEKLNAGTIHLHHLYMQSALALAVRWDWIERNPALRASPPAWAGRDVPLPTVDDVRLLLEVAGRAKSDLASMLFVAATTGLRRGELCGLRWSDIDLDAGSAVVSRSVVQFRGQLLVKAPKSNKPRSLALDPATCLVLDGHRALCEARWHVSANGYVWSHQPGNSTPINPSTVTRFFMRVRDQCDLPHVRLHDLRHFSVTTLLTAGVDVRTVSGRHGHKSGSMTLNRYAHFIKAADMAAANIMGELLRPTD